MAKNDEDKVIEIKEMDFDSALKIVKNDILSDRSAASEHMQAVGAGYKLIKKTCHIQPGAVKQAIAVADKEDAKRDDFLRGFVGMLNKIMGEEILTFNSNDLVDRAESKKSALASVTSPQKEPEVADA